MGHRLRRSGDYSEKGLPISLKETLVSLNSARMKMNGYYPTVNSAGSWKWQAQSPGNTGVMTTILLKRRSSI